jgi:hypothetical protein
MLFLPEIRTGAGHWRFPISSYSASQLAAGVLDAPARRDESFGRALAAEPGLVLWVVLQAGTELSPESGVSDLTNWLVSNIERLRWQEAEFAAAWDTSTDTDRWSAMVPLAALAIVDDKSRQAFKLADMVGAAPAWCSAAGTPWEEAVDGLPEWLARSLNAAQVAEPVPPSETKLARVAERWKASGPSLPAGALLPRTMELVHRSNELQREFEQTLAHEKLEALRELAYGASHEINNPLANISTRAEALLRDEVHPERRRRLATISAQAFRAHEMISDMMLFAKPPDVTFGELQLGPLVASVLGELSEQAAEQGTWIEQHMEWDGTIRADRDHLAVALKNLVRNSLEALDVGGCVSVQCRQLDSASGGRLEIQVTDTGPGIPAEIRPRIFDPFFSGREAGRGLGLGLSKCWKIVELHGGQVNAEATGHTGATFKIQFPATLIVCPSIPSAG